MGRVRQAQVMNLKCSALLECNCRSAAAIHENCCESRLADASPLPVPPQQGHEQQHPRSDQNLDEIGDAWGGTSLPTQPSAVRSQD